MSDFLKSVIAKFERQIQKLNEGRSMRPFHKLEVTVLGQQGLLIRRESLRNLNLVGTRDFDGLLKGEPPLEDIFKRLLMEEGLTYDMDSKYIWLPEETKYETIYESKFIKVDSPLPIYLLASKAVKAPEKNKQLVAQAIEEFGANLIRLLEKYRADLNYFIEGST